VKEDCPAAAQLSAPAAYVAAATLVPRTAACLWSDCNCWQKSWA